jgi:hypothetical protein
MFEGNGGNLLIMMISSDLTLISDRDGEMDNKAAIKIAKQYVAEVFAEEHVHDIALEEINRPAPEVWEITIGFNRPINTPINKQFVALATAVTGQPPNGPVRRSLKVVSISNIEGEVIAMNDA